MYAETLSFPGASGDSLSGRLEQPVGAPWATALFAHCFTCSKDLKAVRRISRSLAEAGVAVFSFDFTGLGESEGVFADTNFSSNVEDLEAAARFLAERGNAPSLLIGHSLGGAAVLAAAHRLPGIEAVATISAPSDPAHLVDTLETAAPGLAERGEATAVLAGRRFTVKRQLLDDLQNQRLLDLVRTLKRPLLIFHSPVDKVVGIDHAAALFGAAKHPKSFVSLDGADHLLLDDPADAEFIGRMLTAWATRYVRRAPERSLEPGVVVVEGGPRGFTASLRAGGHHLLADEPESAGGSDAGPDPYELLLMSLGACTTMTLRMYADRKAWPLEAVRATLRHEKVHAADCAECEAREGRIDVIDRDITLGGPLEDAQRTRLLEIADMCPVHRTLHSEIVVRTREISAD